MFHDTTARRRALHSSFLIIAFWPWRMLATLMANRKTYARLSRMDDFMLKDIGVSRGSIRSAIREGRSRG